MSEPTHYDPWNTSGRVATQCEASDRPTHSQVLDQYGRAIPYPPPRLGFDLTPKSGEAKV